MTRRVLLQTLSLMQYVGCQPIFWTKTSANAPKGHFSSITLKFYDSQLIFPEKYLPILGKFAVPEFAQTAPCTISTNIALYKAINSVNSHYLQFSVTL